MQKYYKYGVIRKKLFIRAVIKPTGNNVTVILFLEILIMVKSHFACCCVTACDWAYM